MIVKALNKLRPGAQWTLVGDTVDWAEEYDGDGNSTGKYICSNLNWLDTEQTMPTKQELDDELQRQITQHTADQYKRLREMEYPPLADLADALYHQSKGDNTKMEAYLEACEAVKIKYPKGSE